MRCYPLKSRLRGGRIGREGKSNDREAWTPTHPRFPSVPVLSFLAPPFVASMLFRQLVVATSAPQFMPRHWSAETNDIDMLEQIRIYQYINGNK